MISKIVRKLEPVTLVGGADVSKSAFERAIVHAPTILAADGGAVHALNLGAIPEAVIGDMDSLDRELKGQLPAASLHFIEEQDSTDFEKCLLRIEAPLIMGVGFLGGRLDHQLAAFHALVRFAHQRCILVNDDELVFLCPPQFSMPLAAGTPVSLFPMGASTGRGEGLKWSFPSLDFEPGLRIGTSNEAIGAVTLEMSAPNMLCILPSDCFELVLKALMAQAGSWPARA
ncbi:thiamine diphosphokinase [Planktotalea sp.]|uniref:thiamine diphosphokinase n=1 Tax=Planktotalea sp. TaxID=2029877 RepID=UPI003299CD08